MVALLVYHSKVEIEGEKILPDNRLKASGYSRGREEEVSYLEQLCR